MLNTFAFQLTARTIKRAFAKRRAAILLALLMTGFVVTTPAQEQHKKPGDPSSVDIRFESLDADEAAVARATVVRDFGSGDPALTIQNATEIKIPAVGTTGIAAPYPLNIIVSGFQGRVGRISVRLHNFSHTYPRDVMALLVGPLGQKVMLMSNVGGHAPVEDVALVFEDGAPKMSPNALGNGTYAPTNNSIWAPAPPAPPKPYSTSLSDFVGTDPNGTWSLYGPGGQ